MCYWKQWRRTKKQVGELMKLGVGERSAVTAGLSRKSYWHLADRSYQCQPVQCLSQRTMAYIDQNTVDQDPQSGHGPISANRLVRTRMPGGVGAGRKNPPATRLGSRHNGLCRATLLPKLSHAIQYSLRYKKCSSINIRRLTSNTRREPSL